MQFLIRNRWLLLLGIVATFCITYRIGYMPLSADEPIRALIALDMDYNGHYVAPEINGDPYFKKPPLYNWLLLGFFKIFNSHAEWVVRLPSLLSTILFTAFAIGICYRETQNKELSVLAGLTWLTGGNLLFYSSYLGHIDVTYSLITLMVIYALYFFGEREQWGWFYGMIYFGSAMGFLMKGLPSIAFLGISLPVYLYFFKNLKDLFRWQHFAGILAFVIPVAAYLYAFSTKADLGLLTQTLWEESSSRTVGDKSFIDSIGHIFSFPFLFVVDIFPWGIGVLVLLKKSVRQAIWTNRFLKFCALLFLSNIIVYWLAPDYRARYVFMLTPLFMIPVLHGILQLSVPKWVLKIPTFAVLILLITGMTSVILETKDVKQMLPPIIALSILAVASIFLVKHFYEVKEIWIILVLLLLNIRALYSIVALPQRMTQNPYQTEKEQGYAIAALTNGNELEMYHSNLNLTMSWYISTRRNSILKTQRTPKDLNAFYLIPAEILTDRENTTTYYTFVRRYLDQPFELVKFKNYFPEMPKHE